MRRLAECFFLLDDFLLLAVGFVFQVLHVLLFDLEQVVLVLPLRGGLALLLIILENEKALDGVLGEGFGVLGWREGVQFWQTRRRHR